MECAVESDGKSSIQSGKASIPTILKVAGTGAAVVAGISLIGFNLLTAAGLGAISWAAFWASKKAKDMGI